jgi:dolichol-phosphate mannosyltransferase
MNQAIRQSAARWMKFNLVGAVGIGVQLAMLWLLTSLGVTYLLATALAVETAVLHNFLWHQRFTWSDRSAGPVLRLLRFNLTTGAVSIAGNLVFMSLLVGEAHLPSVIANLISIGGCSVLNFVISDRWVFRAEKKIV